MQPPRHLNHTPVFQVMFSLAEPGVESAGITGTKGGEEERMTRQSSSIWNWNCGKRKRALRAR